MQEETIEEYNAVKKLSGINLLAELKIHHIGYLVKKMEKAKKLLQMLGYEIEKDIVYDEFRDVEICFLVMDGYRIELVSPRSNESDVGELQLKIGNSLYHICYEVDDLEDCIKQLKHESFIIWEKPKEAVALDNRRAAFLIQGQVGMIELLERS